jgi:hypothetical protein
MHEIVSSPLAPGVSARMSAVFAICGPDINRLVFNVLFPLEIRIGRYEGVTGCIAGRYREVIDDLRCGDCARGRPPSADCSEKKLRRGPTIHGDWHQFCTSVTLEYSRSG